MSSPKKENEPFFLCYFGRQHSGKTYDLEQFVKRCGRHTIFVYNSGRAEDWADHEQIELFSDPKERILYFTYKNKDYPFSQFMSKFKGKKVKAMEADEKLTEELLWRELKVQGKRGIFDGLFFIIDDATGIVTGNISKNQLSCFNKAKHFNIWFALIHHNPSRFPNGAWGALTLVKIFKNNIAPPNAKYDIIPHFDLFVKAHNWLKKAPNYSHCTITMNTAEITAHTYKKPSKSTKKQ